MTQTHNEAGTDSPVGNRTLCELNHWTFNRGRCAKNTSPCPGLAVLPKLTVPS